MKFYKLSFYKFLGIYLNEINFLKLKNNREKVLEIEKNVIIIF